MERRDAKPAGYMNFMKIDWVGLLIRKDKY